MRQHPFNGEPIVTNPFRKDKYAWHTGIDYALVHRTALVAVAAGKISFIRGNETRQWIANTHSDPYKPIGFPVVKRKLKAEDYGNYIKIDHGSNIESLYAHLDEVSVYEGQNVEEGELIGYSDNTGNSTGNHLHFEIRVNGVTVNPEVFYVNNKNFIGKGGEEENEKFYPFETVVTVRPEIDTLFIRSGAARLHAPSGKQKLSGGETVVVKGFVKGERVKYGKMNTQFWWLSTDGHYFWAGGTTLIPTLDDFPELMAKRDKILKGKYMDELKANLEAFKSREQEIVELLEVKTAELEGLRAEIAKSEEALEEVSQPEEAVETIAEEAEAEEAPAEEAVEEVAEEPAEEPAEEVVEEEPVAEPEEVVEEEAPEAPEEEVVEEPVEEAPAEEVAEEPTPEEEAKATVSKLENLIAEVKGKFGL